MEANRGSCDGVELDAVQVDVDFFMIEGHKS